MVNAEQRKGIEQVLASPELSRVTELCILCDRESVSVEIFEPSGKLAASFGVPEGKWKMWFYGLCISCLDLPRIERDERVQAKFFENERLPRGRVQ